MDILHSVIGGTILEYIIQPVGRELGYLCSISTNVEKLKDQVEKLRETRESVHQMIHEARRNAEDINPSVENWLIKADRIIENSEMLLLNEGQVGLCFNLIQRHKLSRKAVEMANEILEIKNEGTFDGVSYNAALLMVRSSITRISDFLKFESRKSTTEQIMNALADDNVNKIGVYGMGGVGKTILVKEISETVMNKRLFDEVVTLTVSQIANLEKIQEQLGDKLGLKFEQERLEGRALKLHKRLKMEKRILVVLDNIWEYIDLETIGVPKVADHKGCKILFTSRGKHILSNDMCTDQNFEIKILQEDESWNLFKKLVGEIVETSDLNPTAIEIVRECANLPIAIATVAKALRNKHSSIWKDALVQLRNPLIMNIRGMNEKVYSSLKLSYKQLECEEAKLLFLLCSMFPDNCCINVEKLHVYAMGMGFLHGIDTVAKGRHRIAKLIDDLISSSLFLQSEFEDNYVKMHDMIRDVAILIASNDNRVRTLSYVERSNKWKDEKISGHYTAVCLDLHKFLEKLMLPKVQVLILNGQLAHEFEFSKVSFDQMNELKVLELNYIEMSVFPSSQSFVNLQSLYLNNCKLGNIDEIHQLKNLNNLSFKESNIVEIPIGIGELTQLKVLDLSFCRQLKVISCNILSRLTRLEELDLEYSFVDWEGEELHRQGKNVSLSELMHMPYLSTLNLCIQDEKIIPKHFFSRNSSLERFKIIIGCGWDVYKSRSSNMLYLNMGLGSHLGYWMKILLKRSEELNLKGAGTWDLLSELDGHGFSHLKHLHLLDNLEVEHFIHGNKPFWKALPNLESLYLSKLKNLKDIITLGYVKESPFNKLRIVKVEGCNKLRNLFFGSVVNGLMNLEKIEVSQCQMMEIVVVKESEEATNGIVFTCLNTLIFNNLPRVTSFFSKIEELGQLRLHNSEGNIGSFFSEHVSFPNLEKLIITKADNLRLVCRRELIPHTFGKLKRVEIFDCNKLEKVFPFNVMSTLTCLKELWISRCAILEGIFVSHGMENCREMFNALLPKLSSLRLIDLPNLKYVWREDPYEILVFENIQELSILRCPELKRVYLGNFLQQLERLKMKCNESVEIYGNEMSARMLEMNQFEYKVSFPNLKDMKIKGIRNLKIICHNVLVQESFAKLEKVEIGSCDSIEKVFPSNMMDVLKCLRILKIKNCSLLEGIFDVQESHSANGFDVLLSQLSCLELLNLPNLKYVWSKDPSELLIFENIEVLSICRCPELKKVYPVKVLQQLKSLGIESGELTEILKKERPGKMVELEQCEASKGKTKELQDDARLFSKLKTLKIFGSLGYTDTHFPMEVAQILPNLEKLGVRDTLFEEIFPNERSINVEKYYDMKSAPLRHLYLSKLPNLRHLWNESSIRHNSLLQNLYTLDAWDCSRLNSLLPSSMSFRNLFRLSIGGCHGLTHLLSPSVATTLEQLCHMNLGGCERMTRIIAEGEAEEDNVEIVFKKLKDLTLHNFPSLASFHSGKRVIKFPSLDSMNINNCPKMKVFSLGIVSMPCLEATSIKLSSKHGPIIIEDIEDINVIILRAWEDNYDSGSQCLFRDKDLEQVQSHHSSTC